LAAFLPDAGFTLVNGVPFWGKVIAHSQAAGKHRLHTPPGVAKFA
jgi:hypothetical protein